MDPELKSKLDEAFGRPAINMRPITIGTTLTLSAHGYDLATKDKTEQVKATMALAWCQMTPLDEVIRIVNSGKMKEAVEAFTWAFPVGKMAELEAELLRVSGMIDAATVMVAKEGDSRSGE